MKWLTTEQNKNLACAPLLPPPGEEAVVQWAKWLADTNKMLGKTRGMLHSVKNGEWTMEELDQILEETVA